MESKLPWFLVVAALAVGAYLWWRSRGTVQSSGTGSGPTTGAGNNAPGGLTLGSDQPPIVPRATFTLPSAAPDGAPPAFSTPTGRPKTIAFFPQLAPAKVGGLFPTLVNVPGRSGNNTPQAVLDKQAADYAAEQAAAAAAKKQHGGGLLNFSNFGY
jgi:hypothetical protein